MTGPRATEAGYDYVVQAMTGWMSLTGDPDGPPTKSGLSLVDLSGGYVAALALIAGLHRARRDGVGCDADISLFETALHELIYVGTWAATGRWTPRRMRDSAHPSIVPFQTFAAADGWITVACAKQGSGSAVRGDRASRPGRTDERFGGFAARDQNRDVLLPVIADVLRGKAPLEWAEIFTEAACRTGQSTMGGALEDRQTLARGGTVDIEHPRSDPCARSPRRCG